MEKTTESRIVNVDEMMRLQNKNVNDKQKRASEFEKNNASEVESVTMTKDITTAVELISATAVERSNPTEIDQVLFARWNTHPRHAKYLRKNKWISKKRRHRRCILCENCSLWWISWHKILRSYHRWLAIRLSDWRTGQSRHSMILSVQNDVKVGQNLHIKLIHYAILRVSVFRNFNSFDDPTTHQRTAKCDIMFHAVWEQPSQKTWRYCVRDDVKRLNKNAPRNGLIRTLTDSKRAERRNATKFMDISNIWSAADMTQN